MVGVEQRVGAAKSAGGSAYRLISADGHYVEPGDIFTSRVPKKFVDQVPRIESFEEGDAWIGGMHNSPFPFGWFSCAGRKPEEMHHWMRWEDVRPGGYDPGARLKEMDEDGVDAEVLFPGVVFGSLATEPDRDLHVAMVQAYNDWVLEFSAKAPDRLLAMPVIANRGVDTAVAEINRVKDQPGVAGFLLQCYPNGTLSIDPEDDQVWGLIEETGKPLSIHVRLLGPRKPQPSKEAKSSAAGAGYANTKKTARKLPGAGHFYDAPGRMLEFIFAGVLDRFPDLKIFFAEVDAGWLPYFEDQADDNFLRHAKADLKDHGLAMLPSQYMRKHFYASFITDYVAIANRHKIGLHRLLWSNDYPHITSDWPESWKTINAAFANLDDADKHAILAGNSMNLFNLK